MAYVTPGTVAAGDVATAAAWNVLVGNDVAFSPLLDAWTNWTPTLTQTGAVTKTINSATFIQIGKLVFAEFNLVVTGSGSGLTGVTVSLPVTAKSKTGVRIGVGSIFDNRPVTQYAAVCYQTSTTTIGFIGDWSAGAQWGSSPAINLAVSDNVAASLTYEAA